MKKMMMIAILGLFVISNISMAKAKKYVYYGGVDYTTTSPNGPYNSTSIHCGNCYDKICKTIFADGSIQIGKDCAIFIHEINSLKGFINCQIEQTDYDPNTGENSNVNKIIYPSNTTIYTDYNQWENAVKQFYGL